MAGLTEALMGRVARTIEAERVSARRVGAELRRAAFDVRAATGSGRRVKFTASTRALDRHGTRIDPKGIDTRNYRRNPVVLYGHDGYGGLGGPPSPENVIGRAVEFEVTADAFVVTVEFATHERAQLVLDLVRSGALNAMSIGFVPRKSHDEREGSRSITVHDEVELLELSIVPVPSNPQALVEGRSLAAPSSDPIGAAVRAFTRATLAAEPALRAPRAESGTLDRLIREVAELSVERDTVARDLDRDRSYAFETGRARSERGEALRRAEALPRPLRADAIAAAHRVYAVTVERIEAERRAR